MLIMFFRYSFVSYSFGVEYVLSIFFNWLREKKEVILLIEVFIFISFFF